MRPTLSSQATRQGGLVTRGQALEAGYTPTELRALTRGTGLWVPVRRGVYAERAHWETLDERTGRPRLRVLAAHLLITGEHVVSHTSAGLLHGLPMLDTRDATIHVTRPGVTGSRTEHGVKHHLAPFIPGQVVQVSGVPTLDLPRTAVDIGREHGYLHGLVACDAVRQRGVTLTQLHDTLAPMENWPHITRARAAVADSDAGGESVGETLTREFIASLGLGEVHTQFSIEVEGRLFFIDLRVGRHLIEFDGRIKYRQPDEGGLASRPAEEIVWEERQRQAAICAQGYGMSRLVWTDLWGSARARTAARVRREFEITTARFGTELPTDYVAVARRTAS